MSAWPPHPANASLRLELASAPAGTDPTNLVDPFVTLGRGTFSRTLLGAVEGPTAAAVRTVAITLQSDEYPLLSEDAAVTCDDVDRSWARTVAVLERASRAARGAGIVEVLAREPGEPALLPPTLFCKVRRAFFRSVCPTCGGPLADVRDDALLERERLPRRDRSLVRFVACAACLADGRHELWTLVRESGMGANVGDQTKLLVAYGALARRSGTALPCQGCERVPTCYPEDGARAADVARVVAPLTFFEARAIATEPLVLRYDECADLLGGAAWADVLARVEEPGRAALLGDVAATLATEPSHLFAADAAGRLPLEILRSKVALFAELCRATAERHRLTRAPHLAIAPARAMARVVGDGGVLPWSWRLDLRLLGSGDAAVEPDASPDEAPSTPWRRPRAVDPVFSAPILRERRLGELPASVTIRRVQPSGARTVLEADLEVDRLDAAELGDKDVLELSVTQGRPPLSLLAAGRAEGGSGRRIAFRSAPLALDAPTTATLQQLTGQTLTRARVAVHPCIHVPVDVHALGMMLLTSLLANRVQHPLDVARAVEDAANRIALAARSAGTAETLVLDEQAVRCLAAESFSTRHLFADPDAHAAGAAAVPAELWLGVLLVGMRAVTTIRGFSVCRGLGDFDPAHPEVKVEYLLQLVLAMLRRIDAALFGLPGRTRELRAAIARVAHDLKVD